MYRKVIAPIIACLLLALLGWLMYRVLEPFLPAMGWALVITVMTFNLYEWLRKKLGGRANIAAILMIIAVTLILVAPAVALAAALSKQAADFYQYIENLISNGNHLQMAKIKLGMYNNKPFVGSLADWVLQHLSAIDEPGATFPEDLKTIIGGVTGLLSSFISNAFHFVVNLVLTLFALFVFYTKGKTLVEEMTSIAPLHASRVRVLLDRYCLVIRVVFMTVVFTALLEGVLGGLGFWVAGLPSPILFGSLIAVFSLAPYLGAAIWIPGSLYLILTGNTVAGVGLLLWCGVVVANSDHLLRPLLLSADDVLSTIQMLVAVIGGVIAFGLSGLILGPLTLVTALFLLEEYHHEITESQAPPPEP